MTEALQSQVYVPTFDCVVSFGSFIDVCRRCKLIDENSTNLVISALVRDKKILIDYIGDAKDVKVNNGSIPSIAMHPFPGGQIRRSRDVHRSTVD